jgi:hypothetical protein
MLGAHLLLLTIFIPRSHRLPTEDTPLCSITSSDGRIIGPGLVADPCHLFRGGSLPLGTFPRDDALNVHSIDLLQGAPLTLNDEEVDQDSRDEITGGEDIAEAEVDLFYNKRGEEGEQEVPEPVARGAESHSLCAIAGWVQFAGDGPDHGAPGGGETENEESGEDNHNDPRRVVGMWRVLMQREMAYGREDHEADEHPDAAGDQRLTSAVVFDNVEAVEGGPEVDAVQDHLRYEAIFNTHGFEDDSAIVEEVIGARELLEHLQRHAQCDAVAHARRIKHRVPLGDGGGLFGLRFGE